jgi:hypothetical protein
VTGYGSEDRGSISNRDWNFIVVIMSEWSLWPAQHAVKCALGVLFWWIKLLDSGADNSLAPILFLIIIRSNTNYFSEYYHTATCFGVSGHHEAHKYSRKVLRVKASPFYIEFCYLQCMDSKIFQMCVNYKIIKL